jgi:hypothetical protein
VVPVFSRLHFSLGRNVTKAKATKSLQLPFRVLLQEEYLSRQDQIHGCFPLTRDELHAVHRSSPGRVQSKSSPSRVELMVNASCARQRPMEFFLVSHIPVAVFAYLGILSASAIKAESSRTPWKKQHVVQTLEAVHQLCTTAVAITQHHETKTNMSSFQNRVDCWYQHNYRQNSRPRCLYALLDRLRKKLVFKYPDHLVRLLCQRQRQDCMR